MSWVRIDDNAPLHPKLMDAGAEAAWLWLSGLAYANRGRTDGLVAKRHLAALYPPLAARAKRLARELELIGLWIDRGDNYEIHDYDHYQGEAMRAAVEARREKARERKRKQRDRERVTTGSSHAVTGRDIERDSHAVTGRDSHGMESRVTSRPRGRARDPVPSRPVPASAAPSAGARMHAREGGAGPPPASGLALGGVVADLWGCYERLSAEHGLAAKPRMPGDEVPIRALLEAGWSPTQVGEGLEAVAKRAAAHPSEREWWDGKRCWREAVLREAVAKLAGDAPARGSPRPTAAQDPRVGRIEPSPHESYPQTLDEMRAESEAF